MLDVEKIIIVTKKTWLEELIEKFNTKSQAKFYIEHMGGSFEVYEAAHKQYHESLLALKRSIPANLKYQVVDINFIPNFLFNRTDLVVVIGPDGLVINTAKYLENQAILAINPDPARIDGVLIPFRVAEVKQQLKAIRDGDEQIAKITMAKAKLNDNQQLFAVNDFFIGNRSHVSARYTISFKGNEENQSSSGIIVSTGAGSTGWFKSILYGAYRIAKATRKELDIYDPDYKFPWSANYLHFAVREPFESKTSGSYLVFGQILEGEELVISSNMPENGAIFSDGIEKDYVNFNSGVVARISVAEKKANLLVSE